MAINEYGAKGCILHSLLRQIKSQREHFLKAQKVRTLIRRDFERAFEHCDVLATPTAPTVAFEIGSKTNDPFAMKLADVCTIPVNMAGLPGISLPCGFHDNLPIGLQLIGNLLDESTILRAAHAYEQATDWHKQRAKGAR